MSTNNHPIGKRLADAVTMFVVLFVSLLLLIYVAYGEAKLTYERFQGDKLSGQVHVIQNAMQTPLRSGLPLHQFVGFNTLAEPLFASDATIASLVVYDPEGQVVFRAGDSSIVQNLPPPSGADLAPEVEEDNGSFPSAATIREKAERKDYTLERVNGQYRVTVPLSNKFEQVGALSITMSQSVVTERVNKSFEPLLFASPAPAFLFAVIIAIFGPAMARRRIPWAQLLYGMVFLAASIGVITTLITLYSDGAQSKARALAGSLGQRVNDLVAFNINIEEIQGLDRTFGEYLSLNPDISAASLTVDGRIEIHTDPIRIGQAWTQTEGYYQYVVDLTPKDGGRSVQVVVELPNDVVFQQITRSVKNFAALFIATAFLANLFFQLGGTVRGPMRDKHQIGYGEPNADHEWMLNYVKPVFFLGVLLEHLTYAFLPQFVQESLQAAGVSESYASVPFVGFYLLFAATLIPAGYIAQRIGPKPLMYLGLIMAGGGLAALAFYPDFWLVTAARCLSGIGQGLLFIGVQSYLLAVAPKGKKTQAAAVIVFGFQGGMISGMAVGSLLVGYMGTNGVFLLGAGIGFVAAAYAIIAVPGISAELMNRASSDSREDLWGSLGRALRDLQFIKTMITIGVPAKAVLTGVVTFGLPLLLAKSGYPQEDIGQIIMIYAICVVCANRFISVYVDRAGSARAVLFQGAMLTGAGLCLAAYSGTMDVGEATHLQTVLLVMGVVMVGAAHGFINAPVVSYIADSRLSAEIGTSTTTATYRFLERVGHVAGPVVVGQLLIWTNYEWSAVAIVGGAIAVFGLLFILSPDDRTPRTSDDGPTDQDHSDGEPASGVLVARSQAAASIPSDRMAAYLSK